MTILELMERSGVRDESLAIAWIKDAIDMIQSNSKERLKVEKFDVMDGVREYPFPKDMVSLNNVSVLDTEDDNRYKRIKRLAFNPLVTEDTNP